MTSTSLPELGQLVQAIEVPYTDEEKAIHSALRRYTKLRSSRAEDNAERFATEFVLKTLKKRLFSCPAAFLTTLEKHEKSLHTARKKVAKPSLKTLQMELDRLDEEYADDTDYDDATADALDTATRLFSEPTAEEEALLKQMKDWAKRARGQRNSVEPKPHGSAEWTCGPTRSESGQSSNTSLCRAKLETRAWPNHDYSGTRDGSE